MRVVLGVVKDHYVVRKVTVERVPERLAELVTRDREVTRRVPGRETTRPLDCRISVNGRPAVGQRLARLGSALTTFLSAR